MPPNGSRDFLNVFHVMDRLYDSSLYSCWSSSRISAVMQWYRIESLSGCVIAWFCLGRFSRGFRAWTVVLHRRTLQRH